MPRGLPTGSNAGGGPSGPDGLVLSALSATGAWAQTSVDACPSGKASCGSQEQVSRTTDGGQTWAQLVP
ncbi:MAG: hypothetical protein ACRDY0_01995 [Acidimicrobiales bacterium]